MLVEPIDVLKLLVEVVLQLHGLLLLLLLIGIISIKDSILLGRSRTTKERISLFLMLIFICFIFDFVFTCCGDVVGQLFEFEYGHKGWPLLLLYANVMIEL